MRVTCSKWIGHSSKANIHVNESVSVIMMKSPDTIVYEQDSQMALSCFHYDSLLCQCFPMQKSQILVTLPENAQDSTIYYLHSHLKNRVKLHITVFSEVTEYKTLTLICMFHIFTEYALCNSNLFTALCKRKKYTLIYNKHKLPLGRAVQL